MADTTRIGSNTARGSSRRATRSSRASDPAPDLGADVAALDDDAAEAGAEDAARDPVDFASGAGGVDRGVCPVGFCPIGMALSAVQGVRPDAVEHVLAAGRELLLAARAVIDARAEESGASSTLERIEID